MMPAITSCIAMVTGLCAIGSARARAPRCSCLQRSPATEMNSNLLPMFSVGIIEPPRFANQGYCGSHSRRKGALDRHERSGRSGAPRVAGRGGSGGAGELPHDRLQAQLLSTRPAAGRLDDRPQLAVRGVEIVVDDRVVVSRALLHLAARQ